MEARFTNHNKKALSLRFFLPRNSCQEEAQEKFEEFFDLHEPLLSPFTILQAKGDFDV